jgi:hypothetical protein
VPDAVGVPLIVTVFVAQLPVTPPGKPVTVAPVAPVVVYMVVVIAVLIHTVCVPPAVNVIVLAGVTVIANVCGVPSPQLFDDVTVTVPEPVAEAVIELLVPPPVCDHPVPE